MHTKEAIRDINKSGSRIMPLEVVKTLLEWSGSIIIKDCCCINSTEAIQQINVSDWPR